MPHALNANNCENVVGVESGNEQLYCASSFVGTILTTVQLLASESVDTCEDKCNDKISLAFAVLRHYTRPIITPSTIVFESICDTVKLAL